MTLEEIEAIPNPLAWLKSYISEAKSDEEFCRLFLEACNEHGTTVGGLNTAGAVARARYVKAHLPLNKREILSSYRDRGF